MKLLSSSNSHSSFDLSASSHTWPPIHRSETCVLLEGHAAKNLENRECASRLVALPRESCLDIVRRALKDIGGQGAASDYARRQARKGESVKFTFALWEKRPVLRQRNPDELKEPQFRKRRSENGAANSPQRIRSAAVMVALLVNRTRVEAQDGMALIERVGHDLFS